jgi:hypothetical protein
MSIRWPELIAAIEDMSTAYEEQHGVRPDSIILPGLTMADVLPYGVGLDLLRAGWMDWGAERRLTELTIARRSN